MNRLPSSFRSVSTGAIPIPPTTTAISCINIDGHIFQLPADPVQNFRFIREQTIASYRAVSDGSATPKDMAFLFGSTFTTLGTPTRPYGNASIPVTGPPAGIANNVSRPVPTTAAVSGSSTSGMAGAARPAATSSASPSERSMANGMKPFAPTSSVNKAKDLVDVGVGEKRSIHDAVAKSYASALATGSENLNGASNSRNTAEDAGIKERKRSKSVDFCLLDPTPTSTPAPVEHISPPASPKSVSSFITSGGQEDIEDDRRFVGHFINLTHAQRDTRKGLDWRIGKYIDGLMTIGGDYAHAVTVKPGCSACSNPAVGHPEGRRCRVLVDGGRRDRYVRSRKCSGCLIGGWECDVGTV